MFNRIRRTYSNCSCKRLLRDGGNRQYKDDAAGEAFDKSAKLLGLPYPGGPLIDKYAQAGQPCTFQNQGWRLYFSFSGLKTAIMNFINNAKQKDAGFVDKR